MKESVLTTTQTAQLLGVSVRTAQLLIENGGLPSWKTPGGHRRVYRSDVEALMKPLSGSTLGKVLVVTTEERLELFEKLFEKVPHISPHFLTNTWAAAISIGFRVPAVLLIDVDGWKACGVALLEICLKDKRLKNTNFIAVTDIQHNDNLVLLSGVMKATLDTLVLSIKKIIDDSDPIISISADNKFPIAPNEGNRLQAVHRSKLADSSSEEQFDRLVWLAAWGLESPIALMTILTSEYQWFKASYGMEMEKTPRSWAFCNYTINQKGIFEVQDLREHPVFSTNPAVVGAPYFRFYAGAPIYDPDGFALGSICIMDFQPRQLDAQQKKALLELAAIASEEVKLQEVLSRS